MCICVSVYVCVCVCVCLYVYVCFATYVQWYVMQVCNVYVHLEDQIGTQSMCKGSIYGNKMHVQRTNPMWHDVHMYREPILWDSACSYTYLSVCTVSQVTFLCHVRKTSYKGT